MARLATVKPGTANHRAVFRSSHNRQPPDLHQTITDITP